MTYEGKQWYLDLRQAGFDGIDPTTLDRQKLHRWFTKIAKEIDHEAISAHYRNRELVPEKSGKKVILSEMDSWRDLIHLYIGKQLDIPVQTLYPKLTAKELRKLKGKLLASYTTSYNNSMYNRTHNVELSTKAIDHIVVMPGETFSFNQTVGRRTIARGYKQAKIIIKGEYSEGVGGGI
jgi:vancomycin resistance protein YoaR